MTLVVGIKAFNEEAHVAEAVASARAAIARTGEGGRVVLGDCASADATITLARKAGADEVLQLVDPAERSCGAGAQLAFQAAGEDASFFYLLDGDMVLDPDFLAAGLSFLRTHPNYAGVGGRVREAHTASIEYQVRERNDRVKGSGATGDVDRLDCGGLYRVDAVRAVGSFADRNLHAFEEYELAARLRAVGWRLARIDADAVRHHGHDTGGYRLMWRRLRSGYAGGAGEVVRAAWSRPHWGIVVRSFAQLRYSVAVYLWWLVLLAAATTRSWGWLAIVALLPLAFLTARRRGLRHGLYSLATWNVIAVGMLQGLVRARRPTDRPIAATRVFAA